MKVDTESVLLLLDQYMGGVFRWGHEDCFLGGASVFRDLYGVDLAEEVRGKYSSEIEAQAILGPFGGSLTTFVEIQAMRNGLYRGTDISEAPIGSLGLSPRGTAIGLDGRCVCIHLRPGVWATKMVRGYSLAGEAEVFWYA